jgi:hypothetical protein
LIPLLVLPVLFVIVVVTSKVGGDRGAVGGLTAATGVVGRGAGVGDGGLSEHGAACGGDDEGRAGNDTWARCWTGT